MVIVWSQVRIAPHKVAGCDLGQGWRVFRASTSGSVRLWLTAFDPQEDWPSTQLQEVPTRQHVCDVMEGRRDALEHRHKMISASARA
jgi:hypothetical protein